MEEVLYYLDQFGREFIIIELTLLVIILFLIVSLWLYNKKRFHQMKHQVPAKVVQSYLDAIIQNSHAFKSALFRGKDLEASAGPSVFPLQNMTGGESVGVSGNSAAELSQKNAEIAALKNQVQEKLSTISDLESALQNASDGKSSGADSAELAKVQSQLKSSLAEIEKLKKQLEKAQSSSGGDASGELTKAQQERDALKEKLQEYEIIEDDLANLKRLQQENEQLRKSLEAGGGAPTAKEAEVEELPAEQEQAAPEPEPAEEVEEQAAPEPEPEDTQPEVSAEEGPEQQASDQNEESESSGDSSGKESKTPEDLLSEFEKMLG